MKNTKVSVSLLLALTLAPHAFGDTKIPQGYKTGTILSDNLLYSIGGGAAIMPPHSAHKPNQYSLGVGWKSDLMCGNFDMKFTIKNQLNGITEGFKDLYGNIIQSATGAVASLPAMIIQRANPQLYDILSNGLYQGKIDFNNFKTSCEALSNKLTDYAMDSKWAKMAGIEEYKEVVATEKDAGKAQKAKDKQNGETGIAWIGGKKHGGRNQPAIEVLGDVIGAGFNLSLGRGATESSPVSTVKCDGMLCSEWTTPKDAADYAKEVLGSSTLKICTTCGESSESKAGEGLPRKIEQATITKAQLLEEILNGTPTPEQLNALSTSTIPVTIGLINALKHSPDAPVLSARLANELAISSEMEKMLLVRRMLLAGMREPNVANNGEALAEIGKYLAQLDQELDQVEREMRLQRSISKTSLAILESRSQQPLDGGSIESSDKRYANLSLEKGANDVEGEVNGFKNERISDGYIAVPRPTGEGLNDINGKYASLANNTANNTMGSVGSYSPQTFSSDKAKADGRATIYTTPDGKLVRREGGTLAWRNNNPGNIICNDYSRKYLGAIGCGAGGFAVFADPDAGTKAIDKLLREGSSYRNATIEQAIHKYAPPHENNTEAYINSVASRMGVSRHTKMSSLDNKQREVMIQAIRKIEGWREGKETQVNQ